VHIPSKTNGLADALLRINQEEEYKKLKLTLLIPPDVFLHVFELGNPGTLENEVAKAQQSYQEIISRWEKMLPIKQHDRLGKTAI